MTKPNRPVARNVVLPTRTPSRRRFLAGAAGALAAPWWVPAAALGRNGETAAGERITVGAIGVGSQGSQNMRGVMQSPSAQVVAVCDCRAPRREAAVRTVNEHGAARAGQATFRACEGYHDFRELLARDDIDAVLVCPPDHWHGVVATAVLRAGKDLYCEKPTGLTIAECRAIRDAARRYGAVFQTGLQQRSDQRFRFACELARGGYLGKIHTVEVAVPAGGSMPWPPVVEPPPGFDYDTWTGPAALRPFDARRCEWLAMYWIYDYCIGFIVNWGVHHLDIAQWGCPEVGTESFELEGVGAIPTEGMCDTIMTWRTVFRFDGGLTMSFTSARGPFGWQKGQGLTREAEQALDACTPEQYHQQGCRFIGEEGWVHVSRSSISAEPRSLLDVAIPPDRARLAQSGNHHRDFLEAVRSRREPVAPVEAGHRASLLGNIADIAVRLRRKVRWDAAAEQFVGDDQANRLCSRAPREPWG
jgi:predicted dehydrogenase